MSRTSQKLALALYHLDSRWVKLRRGIRHRLGLDKPLRIVPYRGFGTRQRAVVKGRVLEDRGDPPGLKQRSMLRSAIASYKRYATWDVPNVRVIISWAERQWETFSDEEGYIEEWVEPPPGATEGWNHPSLRIADAEQDVKVSVAPAPVEVMGEHAEFGVISDIDDTVIVTGVTNLLKRARALFLTDSRVRVPFEGVGALYRALYEGAGGFANNPIIYVSSSPWNLYEHLDEFLREHELPEGAILLRDWGITRTGFAPGGGHGHKLKKIRKVLDAYPDLPFVLIGDSGQEDAEHYRTIVQQEGSRIKAVYIREVHAGKRRHEQLAQIRRDIEAAGSSLVLVRDSLTAAHDALERGLIRREKLAPILKKEIEDQEPE